MSYPEDTYKDAVIYAGDRDPDAFQRALQISEYYKGRVIPLHLSFQDFPSFFRKEITFDCCLFDLGISACQITDEDRGFSFRREGPLDMRMDPKRQSLRAMDLVNWYHPDLLADLIKKYGEDPCAKLIALTIAAERKKAPILTTIQLARLIEKIKSNGKSSYYRHPATQTFQALRMVVNQELEELKCGLEFAWEHLMPGGLIICISFHALEDKIVKDFFTKKGAPNWRIVPDEKEVEFNISSRTAKLRWCMRG